METATFNNVKPLLQSYTLDGDLILCVFKCPQTGQKFAAMTHIPLTINEPVFRGSDESAFNSIRHAFTRIFQKVINGKFGSRLFDDEKFFDTRAILRDEPHSHNEEAINAGIVRAFISIKSHFGWDEVTGSWYAFQSSTKKEYGFEKVLREGKPENDTEKEFFSKVLLLVAGADETLKEIEKLFLFDFVFPVPHDISEISLPEGISKQDCESIKRFEFKKAVILCAWAIALTDRELDSREADFIMKLGIDLGMDELLVMNICETAGKFVLVKYLEHLTLSIEDNDRVRIKAKEISKILLLNETEADEVISKFFND